MVYELNDKSINGGLNEINALGERHFIRFHQPKTPEKNVVISTIFFGTKGGGY